MNVFFNLIFLAAFAIFSDIQASSDPVHHKSTINSVIIVTSDDNHKMAGMNLLPIGGNFSVLKIRDTETMSRIEEAAYRTSLELGLDVFAEAMFAKELHLPGGNTFTGTVERLVLANPFEKYPKDLPRDLHDFLFNFTNQYGSLVVEAFLKTLSDNALYLTTFLRYLDRESVGKYILAAMILSAPDMAPRNAALQLSHTTTDGYKLKIIGFDTPEAFQKMNEGRFKCVPFPIDLPISNEKLPEKVIQLVLSWNCENTIDLRDIGGAPELNIRMRAVQAFVREFPNASMRDVYVFSFVTIKVAPTYQQPSKLKSRFGSPHTSEHYNYYEQSPLLFFYSRVDFNDISHQYENLSEECRRILSDCHPLYSKEQYITLITSICRYINSTQSPTVVECALFLQTLFPGIDISAFVGTWR